MAGRMGRLATKIRGAHIYVYSSIEMFLLSLLCSFNCRIDDEGSSTILFVHCRQKSFLLTNYLGCNMCINRVLRVVLESCEISRNPRSLHITFSVIVRSGFSMVRLNSVFLDPGYIKSVLMLFP